MENRRVLVILTRLRYRTSETYYLPSGFYKKADPLPCEQCNKSLSIQHVLQDYPTQQYKNYLQHWHKKNVNFFNNTITNNTNIVD